MFVRWQSAFRILYLNSRQNQPNNIRHAEFYSFFLTINGHWLAQVKTKLNISSTGQTVMMTMSSIIRFTLKKRIQFQRITTTKLTESNGEWTICIYEEHLMHGRLCPIYGYGMTARVCCFFVILVHHLQYSILHSFQFTFQNTSNIIITYIWCMNINLPIHNLFFSCGWLQKLNQKLCGIKLDSCEWNVHFIPYRESRIEYDECERMN